MITSSEFIWRAAGRPEAKWPSELADGFCSTCGALIDQGVPIEKINNVSFSQHADFFRFGSHVCQACAWMYSYPKQNHRNLLAVGPIEMPILFWPMISWESATDERPSWYDLLKKVLVQSAPDDLLTGVLTTDPKPRLWPRTRMATTKCFGLYVHAPAIDQSGYLSFDLRRVLEIADLVCKALSMGFKKYIRSASLGTIPGSIWNSLYHDHSRMKAHWIEANRIERELKSVRMEPEFILAFLIAGQKKD